MTEIVNSVGAMAGKFGLNYYGPPRHLSKDEKDFRIVCLQEELDEYIAATTKADEFDALLDLLVFTVGTMLRQGFPILPGFQRVMAANMLKQPAMVRTASKRDFELDLIKPQGWKSPVLDDLVGGGNEQP
jgi:predicted HAD superfamily Cof-like phosphohydrolase